ncbi:hypothetical protein JYU34_001486 [Plutella xylostella]|uniref:Nudix hydrolase domain-containing protein n=2 Tax=Plutella xylostella TaxID=51655 RepID=A0ABQ7R425_PLUXY|nr:mitochondrial coenzyme A diphosphatase NUDT8 [Plutella xylostella]KAG7312041.1 hypothetical protein JYU34_001486 [Plutella xylostella]
MSHFTVKHLFSPSVRDVCMANFKKMRVPLTGKRPAARAAVLAPLCAPGGRVSLLYTVRSPMLRAHSGQISFPGGKCDLNETPAQTALRETEEETGLKQNKIEIWGEGPEFPGRNNKVIITPVIGSIMDLKKEDFNVNKNEVAEVFAISLESFCDPKNQHHTQFTNGFILPVFSVEGYKIWGVTAYITHSILRSLLPADVYKNDWTSKKVKLQP